MAKFCSECGAKLEGNEAFCAECGAKIEVLNGNNICNDDKLSNSVTFNQESSKQKSSASINNNQTLNNAQQQKRDVSTTDVLLYSTEKKSLGIGLLLTFFFGGLGMLYASVSGAIIMAVAEIIAFFLCFIGIGIILLPIIHIVSMVWTYMAITSHNKKLIEKMINK